MPKRQKTSVYQLFDYETYTYTYLVVEDATQKAILIDPVSEQLQRDLKLIKETGVELVYVLDTHVHADHITSAGMIRTHLNVKTVFSSAAEVACADIGVHDGDTLKFGNVEIQAIATPGHTSGCMSYYTDGKVFTGDALLIRRCGRTDFQQGDAALLFESIREKLFTLPDETIVYPAHDYTGLPHSTIGLEKQYNIRIALDKSKEEFIEIMENLDLGQPKKIKEAVVANQGCGLSGSTDHSGEGFSMHDLHQQFLKHEYNELIVDIRTSGEYAEGHVPGSQNIPHEEVINHISHFKHYDKVYLYCRTGRRVQMALTALASSGLNNLVGVISSGMPDWIEAEYPYDK